METGLVKAQPTELLKRGISHVHEAFADYMLINPGCTLREMGVHFGYTPAWICTVINSDMFKAYMSGRRTEINAAVAEDLPAKLRAAAHIATERIMEVVEKATDADTIIDSFDKILHRYGYAPNAKGGAQNAAVTVNQQNNVFYLNKDEMASARAKLLEAHNNQPQVPQLKVVTPEAAPEGG